MKVGFRSSVTGTRSTWLSLKAPAKLLKAGESRIVTGHLRVPDGEKIGQLISQFSLKEVSIWVVMGSLKS